MPEENPPTEFPEKPKKAFPWFYCLLAVVIIVVLAGIIAPMAVRTRCGGRSEQTQAISNARQVGLALIEFETEYGTYPSDETAKAVVADFPDHGFDLSGKSSNALFRQLLAAQLTQSEQMFYAKVKSSKRQDGDISPGKALQSGEVGFGFVAGRTSQGNPSRPLVFCPIIPGTDRFDPKPFKGKAVILRIDNSVTSLPIDKSGHAISDGKNILSADHPIWDNKAPDIRYPE